MNKKTVLAIVALALAAGLAGGYWLATSLQPVHTFSLEAPSTERKVLYYRNPMNPAITSPVPAKDEMGMDYIPVYAEGGASAERKVLFYRNPMNPAITSPVPAKDEMGMDYIPVYADGGASGRESAGTVRIDPVIAQNIGVRTARAQQRPLARTIRAAGRVDYDEERLSRLHPKVEGWVEQLFVNKTGEAVKRDSILLDIYSPQLVAGQKEYLLALSNYEALKDNPIDDIRQGARELLRTARERLELLDVPAHQLKDLEQTRRIRKTLHIHSPYAGFVIDLGVRQGQYVTPQTELYALADLSRVWVYADIYEYELPWVKVGDEARVQVAALPGEIFTGTIGYIYPYLENKTRTARVRLELDNPGFRLKRDMFANVTLQADPQPAAVVVPSEAIIRTGTRELVFLVREPGKFEPREIKSGISSEGFTRIIEGVKAGDEVVVSSQFLIDSESKLREATAKMMEALSGDMDEMSMEDMDMSGMSMDNLSMDDMDMSDMTMETIQQERRHDHSHH